MRKWSRHWCVRDICRAWCASIVQITRDCAQIQPVLQVEDDATALPAALTKVEAIGYDAGLRMAERCVQSMRRRLDVQPQGAQTS